MSRAVRDIPALVFVHLFPLLMAWLYLVELRGSADTPTPLAASVAFGLAKVAQLAFPLVYVWCTEPSALRLHAPSGRGLAFGAGFGALVGLAIVGLYFGWFRGSPAFASAPAKMIDILESMHCNGPMRFWLLAAAYSVVHALLEEYYWRWFAFGWLRRYVPVKLAMVVSALGFTAHHVVLLAQYFPGNWPLVTFLSLGITVGGAVWAWLYQRSGSLYAPWLSHGLVDAALYIVGYSLVSPFWSTPAS